MTFTYNLTATQLPAGLAYSNTALSKYLGDANFTNTLTNPHSLTVTYSITNNGTGSTINTTTGEVTVGSIEGTETITASSEATSDYLAGEATYTFGDGQKPGGQAASRRRALWDDEDDF